MDKAKIREAEAEIIDATGFGAMADQVRNGEEDVLDVINSIQNMNAVPEWKKDKLSKAVNKIKEFRTPKEVK